MNGRAEENRRNVRRGLSLVELQVALGLTAVLILGVYGMTIAPMVTITKQTLVDGRLTGEVNAAFTFLGNLVNPGMAAGNRLFVVYNASDAPVADGTAGAKLYVPYSNASQDVTLYARNGALVATQGAQTTTIIAAGVTSVSFTAVLEGNPPVRNAAVLCTLGILSQGSTCTYSTTLLPRNR